jgi:hypothetical protein
MNWPRWAYEASQIPSMEQHRILGVQPSRKCMSWRFSRYSSTAFLIEKGCKTCNPGAPINLHPGHNRLEKEGRYLETALLANKHRALILGIFRLSGMEKRSYLAL